MSKLSDLIRTTAGALSHPEQGERSIGVLAMMLRKAGLIRSTGRGLNAAEMTATDATNLLLACLCGGNVRDVAETVKRLRASGGTVAEQAQPLPLQCFEALPSSHSLGDALDAVIGELSQRERGTVSVGLSVMRDFTGYLTRIVAVSGDGGRLEATYIAPHPDFRKLTRENQFDVNAAARQQYGRKRITEEVGGDVLLSLANCITGRELVTSEA